MIFADNATIHRGEDFMNALEELDIKIVYGLPYSPKYMGTEKIWSCLKSKFRKKLTRYKIKKEKFKVIDVIRVSANSIDKESIRKMARHGWTNIMHDKRNPRYDVINF